MAEQRQQEIIFALNDPYIAKLAKNLPQKMLDAKRWGLSNGKTPCNDRGWSPKVIGNGRSFWDAAYSLVRNSPHWENQSGIGRLHFLVVDGDGITVIDLDHARCQLDGVIYADAKRTVDQFKTYTEASSGPGVHIVLYGQKPGLGIKSGKVEIFDGRGRDGQPSPKPIVITGDLVPGKPAELRDCQAELDQLYHASFPAGSESDGGSHGPGCRCSACQPTAGEKFFPGVAVMLEKIRESKNGEKILRLFNGDTSGHGSDHSAADMALCGHLAFWCNLDAGTVDRVFRASGLYRDKWEAAHHATYAADTIDKALAGKTEHYDWENWRASQPPVAKQVAARCPDLGKGPKKDHSPRSGHRELALTSAQESALESYYAMEARRAAGEDVRITPADDDRLSPEFVTRTVLRPTGKTELVVIKNREVERPIMAGVVEVIRGQYATRIDPDWGKCRRVPDAFFEVAKPTNHVCICFACQNRSCEDCGRIWLRDNVLHFSKTIGQWTPIFMHTADDTDKETERIKKRIQRAKLAAECGQDQPLHVNVPITKDGRLLRLWFSNAEAKGFVKVPQSVACKLLCDAIEGMLPVRDENGTIIKAGETRDIGKSRGLELCKPKPPSSGKYRRVPQQGKRVPISFEDARQAVAEIAGITQDRDWYKFGQRWLKYQDDEEHTLTHLIMAKLKEDYSPPCRLKVVVGRREKNSEYLPQKWLPEVLHEVLTG